MSLSPDTLEMIARARSDLRMGVPVVIEDRGNAVLVLAAETLTPTRFDALRGLGGEPVLALTDWRAATLKARAYDGDVARIAVPDDKDCSWVRAMADPAGDLAYPMKGPFQAVREGTAAVERAGIVIAKAAHLLPAVMTMALASGVPAPDGLTHLPLHDVAHYAQAGARLVDVVAARLPLEAAHDARLHVFRPADGGTEHYALEIGQPPRDGAVLARLHSACFTGDVLGSLKCDCGPQLNGALAQMGAEGAGVLLYLNQEGRGIGLANKMRAYALQNQGFDTVEANHRLGFEDDERDFRIGAEILTSLGFAQVRLMTNNPAKAKMLSRCGIKVAERVPLKVGENPLNSAYLDTKAKRSGHIL